MRTWFTISTCFAVIGLAINVAQALQVQEDAPPRPRIVPAASIPSFQGLANEGSVTTGGTASSKQEPSTTPKTSQQQTSAVSKDNSLQSYDLSFDDLKFEMEKGGNFDRTMLTEQINSYHGATISIRGFILPSYKEKGLTKFVFVRDNKECCFGPGAALYDCVLVRLEKGLKADYTVRPVTIEGKFALKVYKIGGDVMAIYRMTDTKVK